MFLSVIFIIGVIISIVLMLTVFRKTLALDHKALHGQKLAYLAVLFPCCLALIIICASGYGRLDIFSSQAQANFISLAKVPLIIFGLSTVLLTIVVNAHRTIQTQKQIEVTEKKNGIDYFINHYKLCTESAAETITEIEINAHKWIEDDSEQGVKRENLRLKTTLEHKRLNIQYGIFFPKNNLVDGVVTNKPSSLYEIVNEIIIRNMSIGIPSHLKGDFKKEVEEITDNAEIDPFSVLTFEPNDYLLAEQNNPAFTEVRSNKSFKIFSKKTTKLIKEISKLLTQYCVSVKIEQDDKEISNSFMGFFLMPPDGISISNKDKIELIHHSLSHLLDLQVAMGKTEGEAKARAYLQIFQNYLLRLHIIHND